MLFAFVQQYVVYTLTTSDLRIPKFLLLSEDTIVFIVTCVYFYSFTHVVIICIHSLFHPVSVTIQISIWASIYRIGYAYYPFGLGL